jgi:hypothetical protein
MNWRAQHYLSCVLADWTGLRSRHSNGTCMDDQKNKCDLQCSVRKHTTNQDGQKIVQSSEKLPRFRQINIYCSHGN